ncbi:MAG: hypothetical protein K0S55_828, partial [Clostridia bacterium]|nr:hypothetical protein [Clostridia bacterium]
DDASVDYSKLWTIDASKYGKGFFCTDASNTVSWVNDDLSLSLYICPEKHAEVNLKREEKIIKDGIPFYYRVNDVFSDDGETGPDGEYDSGLFYNRDIYFEKDGLGYALNAYSYNKEVIDIAIPEMLQSLAENPDEQISGFDKISEICRIEFENNYINLQIMIIPPPFDIKEFELYADFDLILSKTDDGLEYYSIINRKPEEFNVIIAKTDIGTIEIRGRYFNKPDVIQEDSLDFINLDLIKYIYDHINQ